MHFDDRLATVLRQPATGETIARIQYRQLLDILGSDEGTRGDPAFDAAWLRLDELSQRLPAGARAAILREPGLRLRNSRLISRLAESEPAVAAAALDHASLREEEWLDLVPALPIAARGYLAGRHAPESRVAGLLDQLGIRDRGLPPPSDEAGSAQEEDAAVTDIRESEPAPAPRPLPERVAPAAVISRAPANDIIDLPMREQQEATGGAIRAIVRRIEEFRKARHATLVEEASDDAPRLPLEEPAEAKALWPRAFDFMTDAQGRIVWAEAGVAPMVVGLALTSLDGVDGASAELGSRLNRRQPILGAAIALPGPARIYGLWQIDAAPEFESGSGHYSGHVGRMRRLASEQSAVAAASPAPEGADAMRQVLHELRNPVASIQGFAEMTQQGMQGPIPHEYRALAATIASDSARILAAFDEIERLVKLETGALAIEPGEADLGSLVASVVSHLEAYTARRNSGFALQRDDGPHSVMVAPDDAERMVWRLLASLAGAAAPGEVLRLRLRRTDECVRMTVRLPAALASFDDEGLFRAGLTQTQALSAGMFGTGFALRLATSEAKSAGGSLIRKGDRLRLTLPCPTGAALGHGQQAGVGAHSGLTA